MYEGCVRVESYDVIEMSSWTNKVLIVENCVLFYFVIKALLV